ncbi:MAG: hypothetical protein NTY76_06010 [Candidatus Omnitrophica bacterium]|nr:hypothetical protein [Candidatus Omnitrophota bacterium]
MRRHKIIRVYIVLIALFLSAGAAYAFDDGFGSAKKIESKYAVLYYPPEADVTNLIRSLNVRQADKVLSGLTLGGASSYEDELGLMIDALFGQVSDVLDMHIYSLKINIKICRNNGLLKDVYKRMFNADLQDKQSFYFYSLNTIYTSEEGFKREIVGHEMAHAIISHYFVVPAPIKIQEVLAMYVEYNLRRAEQ